MSKYHNTAKAESVTAAKVKYIYHPPEAPPPPLEPPPNPPPPPPPPPQIYGGPGDFDSNGVVDGEDLSHPTLGWNTRFGGDLDGHDFLIWQRHLGNGGLRGPADMEAAAAHVAPGRGIEPVTSYEWLAYAPLAGFAGVDSGDAKRATFTATTDSALAVKSNAISVGTAVDPAARESAFECFGECGELAADDVKATPVDSDWKDAFADFGVEINAAA